MTLRMDSKKDASTLSVEELRAKRLAALERLAANGGNVEAVKKELPHSTDVVPLKTPPVATAPSALNHPTLDDEDVIPCPDGIDLSCFYAIPREMQLELVKRNVHHEESQHTSRPPPTKKPRTSSSLSIDSSPSSSVRITLDRLISLPSTARPSEHVNRGHCWMYMTNPAKHRGH